MRRFHVTITLSNDDIEVLKKRLGVRTIDFEEARKWVQALVRGAIVDYKGNIAEGLIDGCGVLQEPSVKPCRVCGGYGFVAVKRFIDDGYGEVDSCPACDERDQANTNHDDA